MESLATSIALSVQYHPLMQTIVNVAIISRDRVKRQSIACKTPPPRKNSKFQRTPVRDKDFMYYDLQTEQILKEKQDFDVCVIIIISKLVCNWYLAYMS